MELKMRRYGSSGIREFQSVDALVKILKDRGLTIDDEDEVKHYLMTVGHHRLSDFYPAFLSAPKRFDAVGSSKDIFHLYLFDRRLRLLIFGPIEKIEVGLRALLINEIGAYIAQKQTIGQFFNIFSHELYDLSGVNQEEIKKKESRFYNMNDKITKEAKQKWNHHNNFWTTNLNGVRFQIIRRTFDLSQLNVWEVLEAATLNPLITLFDLLQPEIKDKIANKFDLQTNIFTGLLFGLRDLRNACAHHEPIWNWNANERSRIMKFPRAYVELAAVNDFGRKKLYAYCATIHILLSYLSKGNSTWYRRLKKLVNEFNTIYGPAMGFPDNWQNLPFWCASDVRQSHKIAAIQARVVRTMC
jgi:abortive infection bacteriophage resistance protein